MLGRRLWGLGLQPEARTPGDVLRIVMGLVCFKTGACKNALVGKLNFILKCPYDSKQIKPVPKMPAKQQAVKEEVSGILETKYLIVSFER